MAHRAAGVPEVTGPLTVAGMLREQARRFPDRAALADLAGFRLTYTQLFDRGARRASALLSLGLEPGGRIAAWMDDGTDYVELYVACALAGLVVDKPQAVQGPAAGCTGQECGTAPACRLSRGFPATSR